MTRNHATLVQCALVAIPVLLGCNKSQPNTAPPTPAQLAAENARASNEALKNLTSLEWLDFVAVVKDGNKAAIAKQRSQFIASGNHGFACVVERLKDPKISPDESTLVFQAIEEMMPAVKDHDLRKGTISRILDFRDAASSKDMREQATKCLARTLDIAIDLSPEDAAAHYFRGDERMSHKDYGGAIDDFTTALRLQPMFANAHYLRGLAYRARGNHADAIADYSAALEIEPKYPDILVMRAESFLAQAHPRKAISDLNSAISLKPNSLGAYTLRARAYEALNEKEKSQADLAKAEEIRNQSRKGRSASK